MKFLFDIDGIAYELELSKGETKQIEYKNGRFAKVSIHKIGTFPTKNSIGNAYLRVEFDNGNVWNSKDAVIPKLDTTTIRLYLIDLYETYSAYEKGVTALRNLPKETPYLKYELLEEADVELPEGFTFEETHGGGEEIFFGDKAAEMVTDYDGENFVTELVTSEGTVKLHVWEGNYGH